MILFLNVFITDQGLTKYDRGFLLSSNRVDIFKYSLASLSVIDWSQVIIYYVLDTNYQDRKYEVDEYIRALFRDPVIYPFRNERQSQWQVAMQELFAIKDDLVCFSCNDDHVFVDYETELLGRLETKLRDLAMHHKYVSCYPTHWPEVLFYGRTPPLFTRVGVVEEDKDYFVTIWCNVDSMQIVNKNLLRSWWFEHDYGDTWLPRTDYINSVISPEAACIIPYRELIRHFDGYSHNKISINVCPPLFIPDGFFDNKIKILYCSDTIEKGYVNVNPLKKNYTSVDNEGADLKCVLEDLPLFWQSRIAKVEIARDIKRELLLRGRNQAVLKMAWQKIRLPITRLEVALRFDNTQIPPKELRRLELFGMLHYSIRKGIHKTSLEAMLHNSERKGIRTMFLEEKNYKGLWKDTLALSLSYNPFTPKVWIYYIIVFVPYSIRSAIARLYRKFYYRLSPAPHLENLKLKKDKKRGTKAKQNDK